jgi:GDP-4-dehydro-6-deoxy-D-mannose reductase
MSQRALITGIGGFAAGYLAAHLLDAGDLVLGTDLVEQPSRGDVVRWDLADPSGPSPEAFVAIRDFAPTVVYHLAAVSVPGDCGPDEPTEAAAAVNIEGTRRVVELTATLPSRPRLLFTSSSYVYGKPDPSRPVVDEAAPVAPRRGYGKSKLAAERIVSEAAAAGRVDAVVARAFQHTGPKQSPRMMLPEWAAQCAGFVKRDGRIACERVATPETPIEIHTRNARVDVTDVRDTVRAYRLLAAGGECGAVYNVGSGESRRTGDILALLLRMSGVRREVVELRGGFKQDPIADIARIRAAVGWEPEIPIEETVEAVWQYWKACRGEWKPS